MAAALACVVIVIILRLFRLKCLAMGDKEVVKLFPANDSRASLSQSANIVRDRIEESHQQ